MKKLLSALFVLTLSFFAVASSAMETTITVTSEENPPKPPPFSKVQSILCKEYQLSASECQETAFEIQSIDLNGDKKMEWVYINRSGPLENCFHRHACFSVLGESRRGWEILLSGKGGNIDFSERSHFGYKDLIVYISVTACEHWNRLYVWDGKHYRFKDEVTCYCGDGYIDPVTQKKIEKPSKLCDVLPGGIGLQ